MHTISVHACGGARSRRQETNVLIVSILPAVVVNLALRSNAQGRIKVAGMRKLPILVGLGASAISFVGCCLLLQDLYKSCARGGAHRLGIEPKTPGWEQTSCPTSPSGDLAPTEDGALEPRCV